MKMKQSEYYQKDFSNIFLLNIFIKSIKYLKQYGILQLIRKIEYKIVKNLSYKAWIRKNEPQKIELYKQKIICKKFKLKPLISIILPLYNTPINILRETINSVINQTYTNWEICITNGSPHRKDIIKILQKYSKLDSRIKVKNLKENLGIAGNSNEAISFSTGEFVSFLDHDDTLAPFALFEVINEINKHPDVEIIYSDEDLFIKNEKDRSLPHFKSAFNLELLRCANYMCHFLVVKRSLGNQIGWLRKEFDGAQDFDFILRAIETAKNVLHIPRILYHWRSIESSTANNPNSKPYSSSSGLNALEKHFERLKIDLTPKN